MLASPRTDTIAAIATPAGAGGIGVIRVSGPRALSMAQEFLKREPKPRFAHHCRFRDDRGELIDEGLLIAFPAPRSYTGEDVIELQAHGSPVLLGVLLRRCLELGARLARPGEFSERAFLNDKLDLAQAEAVADLIAASSESAARAALRSLEGEFSQRINTLARQLIDLRVYVEAAIDFPEEEIDFLRTSEVRSRFAVIDMALHELLAGARRGQRLRDGLRVVILGAPNVGKSSLLNALAGHDRAIVTAIPGTTRDVLHEALNVDGLPITVVDTAGLRQTEDEVEREGIHRAGREAHRADLVLWVVEAGDSRDSGLGTRDSGEQDRDPGPGTGDPGKREPGSGACGHAPDRAELEALGLAAGIATLTVHNKIDLGAEPARVERRSDGVHLWLSAKHGEGMDLLRRALLEHAGLGEGSSGDFSARLRHVDALERSQAQLAAARAHALDSGQGELAAEDLRLAHEALGEIVGRFRSDDLLGAIFSSFCIGK
ncbi:MAG: tRNA uridine-5-carboxymethylaminomethyl(34) synthesis GTPase MnmE [Rhodanobacteraceae bacterium]|nr:tRNA uridine-5-carboxymethylaminomethyl(34) synthesis GTPase MnmE [Rhodanobacteraceae bacterium]